MAMITKVLDQNGKHTGKWRVRINMKGQRPTATFDDQGAAKAWARDEEKRISEGARGVVVKGTFADLIRKRLDDAAIPGTKNTIGKSDRVVCLRFLRSTSEYASNKVFQRNCREMDRFDGIEWRDLRLKEGVTSGTVRREMNILGRIGSLAIEEWGMLTVNPFRLGRKARPSENKARERIASPEEFRLLVENANDTLRSAIILAEQTGMREREVAELTASSIDRDRKVARIWVSKTDHATGEAGREVPMTSKALEAFGENGVGLAAHTICRNFTKLCRDLGIENLHFHDLRANFCTWAAEKIDVVALAKILGHKDTKMLMRYYRKNMTDLAAKLDS